MGGVLEGVMKIRFTEKGLSLVVLIVIITVLGFLGTGIVSFIGAKQKSYPLHVQSYQALALANAGIEFAIRFANDKYQIGQTVQDCLGSPITVSFGNGSFTIQYIGGTDYTLKSVGTCGNAKREVWLNRFPGYTQGTGFMLTKTIDPNYSPSSHSSSVNIPLTNLYEQTIYIKYITITLNPTQGSANFLETISFGGSTVYNFNNDSSNPNKTGKGICIPTSGGTGCDAGSLTPAKIPYAFNLNLAIPPGTATEILNFNSASIRGTYTVNFFYDFNTGYTDLKTATFTFIIN